MRGDRKIYGLLRNDKDTAFKSRVSNSNTHWAKISNLDRVATQH